MGLKAVVNKKTGKPTAKTGDYDLVSGDNGKTFTNTGATALVTFTAPPITKDGIEYEFVVTDSDGIKFQADAGDAIQDASQLSGDGGSLTCAQIGGILKVKSILTAGSVFVWFVTYERRTWSLA